MICVYSLEIVAYFVILHFDGWNDKTYVNEKKTEQQMEVDSC